MIAFCILTSFLDLRQKGVSTDPINLDDSSEEEVLQQADKQEEQFRPSEIPTAGQADGSEKIEPEVKEQDKEVKGVGNQGVEAKETKQVAATKQAEVKEAKEAAEVEGRGKEAEETKEIQEVEGQGEDFEEVEEQGEEVEGSTSLTNKRPTFGTGQRYYVPYEGIWGRRMSQWRRMDASTLITEENIFDLFNILAKRYYQV